MSAEIFSAKRGLIMRFFLNFIKSTIRMAVGACILLVSAAIPVYFISVDKVAVVAAGNGTATPEDVARIYLDNAKLTTAILISDCAGLKSDVGNQARALFEKHPNWIPAGGDEPFFEAFYIGGALLPPKTPARRKLRRGIVTLVSAYLPPC